jgi:hypothetical protein
MYLDVTGTQDPASKLRVMKQQRSTMQHVLEDRRLTEPAPATACYETATFNDYNMYWDVTGTQEPAPTTACYETATFNDATCTQDNWNTRSCTSNRVL